MKTLGIDIGSTTLKFALLDEQGTLLYSAYDRHFAKIQESIAKMLQDLRPILADEPVSVALSGSAGMGIAEHADLPFVQEVYAVKIAVQRLQPETDVVIELGGEDAKVLFLTGGFEMRMNGSCAGGTGAFIDQMASLMNVSVSEMNELASNATQLYTIASRCGVFAKSDIQPLLNQGARKEDVSASIFRAVVNQTIAGLAQGRRFAGHILYLGGPLTFLSELRKSFNDVLGQAGKCPENSLYYVAIGAALSKAGQTHTIEELKAVFESQIGRGGYQHCTPLFTSAQEYEEFRARHLAASEGIRELDEPSGIMYLGVDAGSTTVKAVLTDDSGNIFHPYYASNNGNPVALIHDYLTEIGNAYPDMRIQAGASTGYGEEIIKNAFGLSFGLVETIAHFTAAKKFRPDVDFILDIGGQDIKCFKIRNGAIDNLYLNEACSSGCGSFLQTFAGALGMTAEELSKAALFGDAPVDLGSRCTVFMNSSVKQAQKDGASIENIAAGLSISVVKNALYKVIRCTSAQSLGKNIVVQGGTFLSDAVLRAFEQELGANVIRPKYAPIMGAYGAALYAKQHHAQGQKAETVMEMLSGFTHEVRATTCQGCGNHCTLTVNTFKNGRRFIAGNRCDRFTATGNARETYNLYQYKQELLKQYASNVRHPGRRTIGIPFGLNMYELLPFWHAFFTTLGYDVMVSPVSTRKLYTEGQHTIPSDTVCYPAKLMHGHIEALLSMQPDAIFYPDMSYNVEENLGVNHYNCPVVAYYPQVLAMNVKELERTVYISDFVSLSDRKQFIRRMHEIMQKYFGKIARYRIEEAADNAYREYRKYLGEIRLKAQEFIAIASEKDLPVIVLAGRPYHVDPEINHGIDTLITRLGAVVITEDSISHLAPHVDTRVRNQWTYHARLYAAAKYVAGQQPAHRMNLVQLVSFGCGVDAITSDEVRSIVEESGKLYTQLKIDEISNMGAVTIRLRSLFSTLEEKRSQSC